MRENILLKLHCDKHPETELEVSTEPIPNVKSHEDGFTAGSAYEVGIHVRVLPCRKCEHDLYHAQWIIKSIQLMQNGDIVRMEVPNDKI